LKAQVGVIGGVLPGFVTGIHKDSVRRWNLWFPSAGEHFSNNILCLTVSLLECCICTVWLLFCFAYLWVNKVTRSEVFYVFQCLICSYLRAAVRLVWFSFSTLLSCSEYHYYITYK